MISLQIGVPGSGKSLAEQDLARKIVAQGWGAAVIDRAREWDTTATVKVPSASGDTYLERWRGAPPPIEIASDSPDEARAQLVRVQSESGLVLFQHPWEPLDVAQMVADIGDLYFIDDEIDLTAHYKSWKENPIRSFVHRGRHLPDLEGNPREIHILGAARRLQNLHTDLTSMADEVFLFRCQGKGTLDRIKAEGYLSDDETESDILRIRTQPNLRYLRWESMGKRVWGQIRPLD